MIKQTAAYLVPFDRLKRSVGSRDRKLLAAISEKCAWMLAEADELFDEADMNKGWHKTRTCEEALSDLINGADLKHIPHDEGNIYGLALEAMCRFLGRFVGEVYGDWAEELDPFFASWAVPLKFSELYSGNAPISMPFYYEYPILGSWSPQTVAAAAAPLCAIDVAALMTKDKETGKVVRMVADWVAQASNRPGWGIVGFSL